MSCPQPTVVSIGADAPIDWTDPCQRSAALTNAYYAALAGEREVEIRTRSRDAEDLVRFLPVDIEKLRIEMLSAQSECAKATGQRDPNRRFPIRLGYRRAFGRPDYTDPYDPRG